jgi:hypothetical protein
MNEELTKENPCVGCQFYGKLDKVETYRGNETFSGIAFICKNSDLIKKIDPKKRKPIFVDGKKIEDAIQIGQVFMNCERGKP